MHIRQHTSCSRRRPIGVAYRTPGIFVSATCLLLLLLWPADAIHAAKEDVSLGADIYAEQCADCHGRRGEGVEDIFPDSLQGERPLLDLAKLINDTMPDGEPKSCQGRDAEQAAAFIFETFYTPEARERCRPPRISASRLTVRQYRNTVADLIATFVGEGQVGSEQGLTGQYFEGRNYRSDKRKLERVDAQVDFAFGAESPLPGKIGAEEFSMQWQGGVLAPDTGDYEFTVKTENGFRLFVNDHEVPLIDGWVKSGDETIHTATLRLLGGRVYPIRLEHFKFKDKTASVSLQWQPPHGVRQVIPSRNLTPGRFPPVMVVTTDFPADDSSSGYERGISVSKAWDQATTFAAIEIVDRLTPHLDTLAKTSPDAADRRERLQAFCLRFAERAFRRPLSEDLQSFFVLDRFQSEEDLATAVKKCLLLTLKSPRFLYLGIHQGELDDFEVAARLAFGLWDSLPDQGLLSAAANGQLSKIDQVERHARRMVANPKTKAKFRYFMQQWMQVERGYDLSKDPTAFDGFDKSLLADLRTSLDLFVEDVVWSDDSDFRQLLLANELYVNRRMADFYAIDSPEGDGFHKVSLPPDSCAGVVTHPYLMTTFAYHKSSSPIHRGVFLIRGVLGRALKPPPIAVAPTDEGMNPDWTTRERVTQQTAAEACMTCHSMINPLGFSLENYDAVGRYRSAENSKPVNAAGSYQPLNGDAVEFRGARELAEFLADCPETHAAFVNQLFHHLVKQPITAYAADETDQLAARFAEHDFNVQDLMVEIMLASALTN